MLINYFLIAYRNIHKHFSYSFINIVGLGLGLATCLLLTLWIQHELSYDDFHEKKDRIYRAALEYSFGGQTAQTPVSPTALLPALQKNFAEVENGVRFYNSSTFNPFILRKGDRLFEESRFYFADSTFFQVFTFRFKSGHATEALHKPQSLVLTSSMAKKYFGHDDVIGETILVNNRTDYTITGVLEDLPSNSMLQFDFIASFSSLPASKTPIWWSANYQTYLVLAPNTNLPSLQEKVNDLVKKELGSELSNPGDFVKYNLAPLSSIYLRSSLQEPEVVGSIQYVYIFSAIAALILLIACINYINLATAKAAERAKEVGIRKVVGALRQQLVLQFIGESVVLTFFAFSFALLLSSLCLSLFNELTGKAFTVADLLHPPFILACVASLLSIAVLAGAYPALFITSFKPVQILKGNFKTSGQGVWLRKSLVVFQFSISIILIIGTLVIYDQLRFIQNQRLGFDTENIIVLPLDRKTGEVFSQLKTELLRSGKVSGIGRATEAPTRIQGGYSINFPGSTERGMLITAMSIDEDFIPAVGIELVAGRNFTAQDLERLNTDTVYSFLLNETALRELSLEPEQALGTKLKMNGRNGEVVGVVKDFHYSSLHDKIGPLALFSDYALNPQLNYIFLRLNKGDLKESLAGIQAICQNLTPHRPFEYKFLDEKYQALYLAEQRMSNICTVFASLTIIIACLGLLGLVSFAAAQKTKEIGIRKVMGASAPSIVVLIVKDFSLLITLATVIGIPFAWYVMENLWLAHFAYRVEMQVGTFIGASVFCFLLAFATAGYQAVKAALINPAYTLRNQ